MQNANCSLFRNAWALRPLRAKKLSLQASHKRKRQFRGARGIYIRNISRKTARTYPAALRPRSRKHSARRTKMECYYPLLQAAGFDLEFDEAEIFLIAKGILDDPEFSRRVDDNGDDAEIGRAH